MEYTSKERKKDLVKFMNNVNSELKNNNYNFVYELLNSKVLSSGIEGKIYKSTFKYPNYGQMIIIIKSVNLLSIKESKIISKKVLEATPNELYGMFKSETEYNKNSLIELISQTLTNQLIFQKICPHYSLNYYWEFDSDYKIISSYNEYANAESFYKWGQKEHSNKIWFNALFQIMYSLICLKRYYNMSHTDFHTDNILVQKVKPGGFWTYTLNNKKYYLPNLGFVFLLHDFGFSWIPGKLVVKWHYKDTLKYITDIGKEFYDLGNFINNLKIDFKLPRYFEWFIDNNFLPEEIEYILTKDYYKQLYEYIPNKELKKKYKEYPDINKNYKGNKMTLEKKFYFLFYDINSHDLSKNKFAEKYLYKNKITGRPIERYSSDKYLNYKKLPKNLQKMLI
jgi:hypothetical protein